MSFTQLKDAFKHLERGEYWHLRYWSALERHFKINSWSDWNKLLSNASWGDTGLLNFLCFCLIMHKARTTPDLIDEEKRNKYGSWNEFFKTYLENFPDVINYQRMYKAAEEEFGIEFRKHGQNHSPIADILNYSGYIYRKLLDTAPEDLATKCDIPIEELNKILSQIQQLQQRTDLTVEYIAEELRISIVAAKQIYQKLGHNTNLPRVCRQNGKLVYCLPKKIDFGAAEENILFRFTIGAEKSRSRYRREKNNCWHLFSGNDIVPLAKCSEIYIKGLEKEEVLQPFYIFEGETGTYPVSKLRTNTSYFCLKSGTFPQKSRIVVEYSDGRQEGFINGQTLQPGSKLLLIDEENRILRDIDVYDGNEIDFAFLSQPVDWVAKNDYPCFSTFPELGLGVDNAEYYLNGKQVDDFETAAKDKYGNISLEVKTQNSRRKKTCRLLPRDFKVSVRVDGKDFDYISDRLEFSKEVTIVFESEHLEKKRVEFTLPPMETLLENKLTLDNGDMIPIKFNISRKPGAYISLAGIGEIPMSYIPLGENQKNVFVDWDEFREFGKLHISRDSDQVLGVALYRANTCLGGDCFKKLEISYDDLSDIITNEAELLSVTRLEVIFLKPGQNRNNVYRTSVNFRASSLERVRSERTEDGTLRLKFSCPRRLRRPFFLVLKKVEDQTEDPIIVLPEQGKFPKFPGYCRISDVRCKIRFFFDVRNNYSYAQLEIPRFYNEGQTDFPAEAYLGFIMKAKYGGFIRCNQGFFIKTEWKPENEDKYLEDLMCGKEFLDIYGEGSAAVLEEKFKSDDERIEPFIDKFLEFSKFSQAQAFMDICFHRAEFDSSGERRCAPSGYIFLAEKYWLRKLVAGEYHEELYLYWDPALFSEEAMEELDFPEINEEYKRNWPALYALQCIKQNREYGDTVSPEEIQKEVENVRRNNPFTGNSISLKNLETYAEWLSEWRRNRSVCYPNSGKFYNLRSKLQTLRCYYPLCYRYVLEMSIGIIESDSEETRTFEKLLDSIFNSRSRKNGI